MEWILYSNVEGLYFSWKDSGSNPFEILERHKSTSHTHTLGILSYEREIDMCFLLYKILKYHAKYLHLFQAKDL